MTGVAPMNEIIHDRGFYKRIEVGLEDEEEDTEEHKSAN